ncbi:MAG: sensor histidine kinase [Anaerolineae bacterium]
MGAISPHELIALLSHEIRSPLAYIMASAELLLDEDLDAGQRNELLRNVRSHAGRLGRLLENLLDAERLAHGEGEVEREPLALGPLAKRLVADVQARSGGRTITLRCPKNLPLVWGDEIKTEIILENLLSNAIKYSPAESPISVQIETLQDGGVVVSVSDEGIGIPSQHLTSVFDLYRRLGQSGSTPGHGIGLYVSKVFVEAQGGNIWVRSKQGVGSTFSFTLPRFQEAWGDD